MKIALLIRRKWLQGFDMKPESKVVSLETAKKLKEVGFPQETERVWYESGDGLWSLGNYADAINYGYDRSNSTAIGYGVATSAAPDAQELGELLPAFIQYEGRTIFFYEWKDDANQWRCTYGLWGKVWVAFGKSIEQEARAACWLYLKENKLI